MSRRATSLALPRDVISRPSSVISPFRSEHHDEADEVGALRLRDALRLGLPPNEEILVCDSLWVAISSYSALCPAPRASETASRLAGGTRLLNDLGLPSTGRNGAISQEEVAQRISPPNNKKNMD
jgi:hypothetical protein